MTAPLLTVQGLEYIYPGGVVALRGLDLSIERGQKLYDSKLKSLLEPVHNGKFVVIDVDTGKWKKAELP